MIDNRQNIPDDTHQIDKFSIMHPLLQKNIYISNEYKYIFDNLKPEKKANLLKHNEAQINKVLSIVKKQYDTTGKSDYLLTTERTILHQTPKIALIVPFRDSEKEKSRTLQLNKFVNYMETYLAGYNYKIFVIQQTDDNNKFNRGQLLNIGFELAERNNYDNYIFHDVDLLPSTELKDYYITIPTNKPIHIAAVWDRYNSNPNYFGGIVAFNKDMFNKINGYPNNFWGWGGEDDELLKRTKQFYNITKPSSGSIQDLENLNLSQKLDYLKENNLKFMKKQEALAEHATTWNINGLSNLKYNKQSITSCGHNCETYTVELLVDTPSKAVDNAIAYDHPQYKVAPADLFRVVDEVTEETNKHLSPPEAFNNLVKTFYALELYKSSASTINNELEVRFGTKYMKDIKPLTKNDYDNVVKVLKSFGFTTLNPTGTPSLRIKCEFLDSTTGRFKMSDVRTEIDGIFGIQHYCKTDDIKAVFKLFSSEVQFVNKRPFIRQDNRQLIKTVDVDDFNFRVSLQTEEVAKKGIENFIMENWRKSKKEFRYINRVSFEHPNYPVRVDLSISKSGTKGRHAKGYQYIIPVHTISESNVFNNQESYEIEIEVKNNELGPTTKYTDASQLLTSLRKVIKFVLGGLQGTIYPISYPEQHDILEKYMKMIWGDDFDVSKKIHSQYFIGPSPITLQLQHIAPLNDNTIVPNIRSDYVVTEKADGERHLMYISDTGKIYFITTNMDVKFTGAKTTNEECFNSLFDGELITHNKKGEFINLFAAFDIYYYKNIDVRGYTFLLQTTEDDIYKSRFYLLDKLKNAIKPMSIVDTKTSSSTGLNVTALLSRYSTLKVAPIRFEVKKFYPMSAKQTIFNGCKTILEREKQHLFEYETDGLIFTPMYLGVGSNIVGKAGPKTKVAWDKAFKWKPPEFNTIDFLITTLKSQTNDDIIKSMHEDGIATADYIQHNEYKTIELRCGFSEKRDGYINPCQDIINDTIPEYQPRFEDTHNDDYLPKRFYPTEPYDPNAGLCNILLKLDDAGVKQMFALNGEVITDNTIVEFSYDIDELNTEWRWKPLRVRHDKTAKLRRGEKEYGNSYKVCNENWKSIHPAGKITEQMLITGQDIPNIQISEDIYYNTPSGKMKTECLKNFHNLYVKKLLITGPSKNGDTLIDYACGKAGDLSKWISANLSFVFGIDYSKDNIENRLDGACVRYLNAKKNNKKMPSALFVHGNSSLNILNGTALMNDKAKQITNAIFGNIPKDTEQLGKGVVKQYAKGEGGFNISSCQFAIHYFFESPDTLNGFLRNITECTKLNGYFIGTSYDGNLLFNELRKIKNGEGVQLMDDGKKVWEVIKNYTADTFEANSSSIGYKINVYQESINQYIYEYLVNYEYLNRLMEMYGFTLISKEEAIDFGLPDSTGLFSELFINMLDEINKHKFKSTLFGNAPNMSNIEKKISFLNRYFIYKKVREVNINSIILDMNEYNENISQVEKLETNNAITIAKTTENKIKNKIKKLPKKLLLIPATEANNEELPKQIVNVIKQNKAVNKLPQKPAVRLIIESDSDTD